MPVVELNNQVQKLLSEEKKEIVKILRKLSNLVKEEQDGDNWDWDAYYVNFGSDNAVGGDDNSSDSLVAEDTVSWVESNSTDDWGNTMWIPDLSQTGYLILDTNKTINLDRKTFKIT